MALQKAFIIILLILMPVFSVTAQPEGQEDSQIRFWGYHSQGISTLGAGSAAGISLEYERHVFSLRTVSTASEPFSDTWDVALTYGRSSNIGIFQLIGAVGVSTIRGEQYSGLFGSDSEGQMEPMIGFPIEGHLSWPATKYTAIGLYAFGNVNTNQPIMGLGLSMRVGLVR